MDATSDIDEKDFVQFLSSLGVETYGLSFGWMLNDYDDFGLLRWLYTNLDHNNALTERERYRYTELEEKNLLLPPEELEHTISRLLDEFPGLTLPGDLAGLEVAKLQNTFYKERLNLLERQESNLQTLAKQNNLSEQELSQQIAELNEVMIRNSVEEKSAVGECIGLAEDIEKKQEALVDIVGESLSVYGNYNMDQELSKNFFVCGPLNAYMQSRKLFKSHFYHYAARRFDSVGQSNASETDGNQNVVTAKLVGKRLYDVIIAYMDSVGELNGVHQKINFAMNYQALHPCQIPIVSAECLSAVELLHQDVELLKEEVRVEARSFVEARTMAAVTARAQSVLAERRAVYDSLCWLYESASNAYSLDTVLYWALRQEARRAEDLLQFSTDFKEFVLEQESNVANRIDSMKAIIQEHALCEKEFETRNFLLNALCKIYGISQGAGLPALMKEAADVRKSIAELTEEIDSNFKKKEDYLKEHVELVGRLAMRVWGGRDAALARELHGLRGELAAVEQDIMETAGLFTTFSKDKGDSRKLWLWYLSEPEKLVAKIAEMENSHAPRLPFNS